MVEADEWDELGTTVDAGGAELELLIGVAFTVEDDDEEEVATGAAELDAGAVAALEDVFEDVVAFVEDVEAFVDEVAFVEDLLEVDAGADEAFEVEVAVAALEDDFVEEVDEVLGVDFGVDFTEELDVLVELVVEVFLEELVEEVLCDVLDEAGSGVEAPYVYVKYSVTYTTSYSVTTARSWCWCL